MPTPTPASNNKFAVLTDNMDLDEDAQGVSASIHAPPTFADMVSGTTAAAPLEHALHAAQPELDNQVGYTPQTWKTLLHNLQFKKLRNMPAVDTYVEPSVGDKRPYGLVGDHPPMDMPSKHTPSVTGHPVMAPASPAPTSTPRMRGSLMTRSATVVPLSTPPSSPAAAGTPQTDAGSVAAQVHLTLDLEEAVIQGMLIDPAVPNIHNHVNHAYIPPDNARVLPPPHGGFPAVQGLEQGLLSFVHKQTIERWMTWGRASALVYIANDSFTTNLSTHVNAIASFFSAVFPSFPAPTIGPPELFKKNDVAYRPVFPFFISGTDDLIDALNSRSCWPTPSITLFVTSMFPEASNFAIAITGFPLACSDASDAIVAEAVREAISNNATATTFITNNADNLLDVHPDDYVDHVLNSIAVRSCSVMEENISVVIFNLYIMPPTEVPDRLKTWILNLKALKFACFQGAGYSRRAFYCGTCKGRDHPGSLCPFTTIIGWPASPAFTDEVNTNSTPASASGGSCGGHNGRGARGSFSNRGRHGRGAF
ncbi:uncharacterized protein LACBIDRAFT_332867 [Laccaria bicolor S238N-H82]|uniref:Predicted protein n=1 Tax=Laccaria bicolor (strain S238N-H82 / ATCC MYA-4686) TaxID=486041 RepID=B0DU42_LACBS|nr:uncharacterized protein LACBIDRAFT_332867 [Laccaria bicolor S238N-H82]EDR01838.1 predicted protein [Laccaria bicolor S238N-H82]|eukprot:XP_001887448.1 predicted protein [Laccaria bicolor S238N-H82]